MKHPVWNNLKFPWIEGEQRRNGKEEQEGRGEFFSLCKIHHLSCLQSFRRWSVMQVVGLRTFSSSQKFIIKPHKFFSFSGRKSQDTDHGYSEEQNWIFYFPRGRRSKKGGGGHVSLFRHVGKTSVLSYQSRSENWGDFLSGRCCKCWKAMSLSHIIT